ncbi:uncharacterized protein LOC130046542 isoform X2 [Ostrea edulis]|uniref:uncharacterized protein LOC130046542 isoform X2 n=1 Tax=Ostrea edulis TaxID=37623 RepID=UPI0024AECB16|nr:uncharacterized protein LOC130046542 isoform X2 [Ostrea edulis]
MHSVEDTMNSNISRLVLCFALVDLVNSQLLCDGHSENQECEVMEMLRKALSDGENLQTQVTQLNKEIQVLKRWMGCPQNWELYNNSCYKLFLSKESWSDAQLVFGQEERMPEKKGSGYGGPPTPQCHLLTGEIINLIIGLQLVNIV